MTRAFALTPRHSLLTALAVVAALVLGVFSPATAAENPDYKDIVKQFKKDFKTKNPLKKRRKAVSTMARSKDPRAVVELQKALKSQEKHAGKKRKEWETQEEEWAEKTERLQKAYDKLVERAQKNGQDTVSLGNEMAEWLGANNQEGKMHREKRRLEKLYSTILEEETFTIRILRGMAKILNGLEGEEYEKSCDKLVKAALKAPKKLESEYVKVLGYTKGDAVTDALEKKTQDTNPRIVMTALYSLGRQNTEKGKHILFRFLDDERWPIRSAAVEGLAFYKDAEVVDRLIEQAGKEEGSVKRRCFQALSIIVGEKVKAVMEAWKSWWKANKEDVLERWQRLPSNGLPIQDDLPVIPMESEENSGSTSFYGIKTNSKHIIFVVDVSGSMRKPEDAPEEMKAPIDVARTELLNALKTLSAADEDERGAASFNIVAFDSFVKVFKDGKMVTATKKNKEKAFKWIEEHIQANTMTNAFDALAKAFDIVRGSSDKKEMTKGADTIFFMTDGHPNRGKFFDTGLIVAEITRMNEERKLTIHAIGVGPGAQRSFLQGLAAANNGKYIHRE